MYADLGYVTAWCKTYYPAQFMAAVLTMEDTAKEMETHYAEVKRMGVKLLPPDVNKSLGDFTVELDDDGRWAIRLGLASIKGLGNKVADHIIAARKAPAVVKALELYDEIDDTMVLLDTEFMDFPEFISRIDRRTVNRSFLTLLAKAGAFDRFEENRHVTLQYISDNLITTKADKTSWPSADFTEKVALAWEKDLLGVYVSSHPFDSLPYQPLVSIGDREEVDIGGQVLNIKKIKTKAGDTMAFVSVQTQAEKMDVTFFPKTWTEFEDRIWKDNVAIFRVRKEIKPDKVNWIADAVLYAKKDQVSNLAVAERPDDLPKKPKGAGKKQKLTMEDLGMNEPKDDPLMELFG